MSQELNNFGNNYTEVCSVSQNAFIIGNRSCASYLMDTICMMQIGQNGYLLSVVVIQHEVKDRYCMT
jgi:hypothetical protein